MGMLAGSVVVSTVRSKAVALGLMVVLLGVHLWTNYMAVRSVSMRTLNRQRANIVLSQLLAHDEVLAPETVAAWHERVFEWRDGVLRGVDREVLGWGRLGVGLWEVLHVLPSSAEDGRGSQGRGDSAWVWSSGMAGARVLGGSGGGGGGAGGGGTGGGEKHVVRDPSLAALLAIFERERYVLWFDRRTRTALIVLKQNASPVAQLQAWTQALMMATRHAARSGGKSSGRQQQKQQQEQEQERRSGSRGGQWQTVLSCKGRRGEASARGVDGVDGAAAEEAFAEAEAELRLTLERARDLFGELEFGTDDDDDDADDNDVNNDASDGQAGHGHGGTKRRRGLARKRLEAAGWDLSVAALETRSGSRLQTVAGGRRRQGTT